MASPMTSAEVAAWLGVSRGTIVRLAASGDLPHAQKLPGIRGAYLFDPGTVALWARQNGRLLKKTA